MKFIINKVHLWKKPNNERIDVEFQPNKINVITGDSNTGKTSLLKIIDYCLFSKNNDIPDDVNEFVFAYGISVSTKNKSFTIIRETNGDSGKVSSNFRFVLEEQELPLKLPMDSFGKDSVNDRYIKKHLETEFGIKETVQLLPKGNKIKQGSTLNLEYFFIFNTISKNIIIDENDFFDFQLNKRDRELYRQALDSIFDLSIGLSPEENYKRRLEKGKLEADRHKIIKKKEAEEKRVKEDTKFVNKLIYQAKEHELVDDEIDLANVEQTFQILKQRVNLEYNSLKKAERPKNIKELEDKRRKLTQQIRNLIKFKNEINDYGSLMTEESETLLPIKHLSDNYFQLINLSEVTDFLTSLKNELEEVRHVAKSVEPANYNIEEEHNKLEKELSEVEKELNQYPKSPKFSGQIERAIFLGEARTKIENFLGKKKSKKDEVEDYDKEIEFYTREIHKVESAMPQDYNQQKKLKLELLNELIQDHTNKISNCLGNYHNYRTSFDLDNKQLGLRKPHEDKLSSIDGTSNLLFLHTTLFLGLHELFLMQKDKNYIPQFFIMDYPSIPYKSGKEESENEINNDDRNKLTQLFELLNSFISKVTNSPENNHDFQIIILDHVDPEIWASNDKLDKFHLVDEFRNGNTLLNKHEKTK